MLSAPSSTATGGAAPAISPTTERAAFPLGAPGALISVLLTIGAPHIWVTPCCGIHSKILAGSTLRRQTLIPADAAPVHGKHQPLQWNIGSVHRYTEWRGMPQSPMLDSAFRYAPRW